MTSKMIKFVGYSYWLVKVYSGHCKMVHDHAAVMTFYFTFRKDKIISVYYVKINKPSGLSYDL